MNLKLPKIFRAARPLGAAVVALVLLSAVAVRAEAPRWLFIFDTSSGMKKRLPAVVATTETLLRTDFASSLHAGDSVGVWTFDEKLRMGKFPLVTWDPQHAGFTISNLMAFVGKQSYSGTTTFDVLQPMLGNVIEDSERLTVVIVCDGEGEIHWTPYDEGMNETLKQTQDDRKKIHQPYVIVLRTQEGKYVGATVNFPPLAANLPAFPLLPREIKAMAVPPPVVKPPPVVMAPPLIIVGTHVSSDTNDLTKLSAAPVNPPPPVVPKAEVATVPPAATVVAPAVTTPPIATPPAAVAAAVTAVPATTSTGVVVVTNEPAPAPMVAGTGDRDTQILTYVGVGLLGAAVALVIFLITRGRATPQSSLITSSMQSERRPPEQK